MTLWEILNMKKVNDIYIGKTKKIKISECIYLVAFSIYLTFLMLSTTMFNAHIYYKVPIAIIAIMACAICIKMVLFDSFSKKEMILGIIFFICVTIIFLKSRFYYMVFLSVFVVGAKNVDFTKICKIYLIIGIAITVISAIAAHFNIIEHIIRYRDGKPRYSFGSGYATDFAARIFFLCAVYSYLKYKSLSIKDSIIFWILGIFVLYFCDARLDTISIFILSLLPIIKHTLKNKLYKSKFVEIIITLCIPLFAIISLSMSYIYNPNNEFMVILNKIFSNRFSLGKKGLDEYAITLFGQDIKMRGMGGSSEPVLDYFFIDSSYLQIVLLYGSVFLVMICIYYVLFIKDRFKNEDILLPILIFIVGINGIVAHHFINPAYNVFIIALFANITKNKWIESATK